MHRVPVMSSDGCHVCAEAAGNPTRPSLLFIPGIGVSAAWWNKQCESLAQSYYLVRFDLRGHGASDKPTAPEAYQESKRWADDVAAILSACGLRKPAVIAWSYGILVLADYLRHYGEQALSRLVLVDGGMHLNTEQAGPLFHPQCFEAVGGIFSDHTATYRKGVQAAFEQLTAHLVEEADRAAFLGASYLVAPATWQAMLSRKIDTTDVFRNVTLPTLVVYGERDRIFTRLAAEQFVAIMPNAQLSLYPNSGHAPFYEEAARFTQELERFVRDHLATPQPGVSRNTLPEGGTGAAL